MFRSMKCYAVASLCLLLAVASVACAQTSRPAADPLSPASLPADQIELKTAVTFAKPGGTVLNLDMALPKVGKGPRPAVVCIYGGGWMSGSRTGMRSFIQYLAGYGYVAVAPTYRLAPQHPFPAAVADVRQCVRWLRRNAKEYNIDPDHIGAMGQSAGGHLALMLGMASDKDRFGPDDEPQAGESARVQAVVNYFGPADMASKEWSALANRRFIVPFLGGTPAQRPDEYRKASPITYVARDVAPILTLQGDKDTTVPMPMAVELHKKLDAVGATNKLVIFEGLGHGSWREPYMTESRQQMVRFFDAYLRGGAPASRHANAPTAMAGFAEVDITPPVGIDLGGRGCSNEKSTEVVDPLAAQATVLKDADGNMLVIVSLDLVGLSRSYSEPLRADLARKLGVPIENVILNCSHTHSGPMMFRDVIAMCGPPTELERKYMDELAPKILGLCAAAVQNLAPVVIHIHRGRSDIGIDRRGKNAAGRPAIAPNPDGPYDPTVWIMCLDSADGRTRGVLFSYACHPVAFYLYSRKAISADYPGVTRRELRAALGKDVHVQFLQGAGASIRPRAAADLENHVFRSGPQDKDNAGKQLAAAVLAGMKEKGRTVSLQLAASTARIDLPRGEPPARSVYERIARQGNAYETAAARYWLEQYDKGGPTQKTIPWLVGVVRLAPDQWLCYFSGEPVVQWAFHLREWFGDKPVVVLGYTQELFGYLPVDEILKDGGYEVITANLYRVGNPAPFAPGLNDAVRKSVMAQLAAIESKAASP